MEISDYMLWKAIIIVIGAFLWGLYCGLTGRSMRLGPPDSQAGQTQDSPEAAAKR